MARGGASPIFAEAIRHDAFDVLKCLADAHIGSLVYVHIGVGLVTIGSVVNHQRRTNFDLRNGSRGVDLLRIAITKQTVYMSSCLLTIPNVLLLCNYAIYMDAFIHLQTKSRVVYRTGGEGGDPTIPSSGMYPE